MQRRHAEPPKPLTAGPHDKPVVKSSDDLPWRRAGHYADDPDRLKRLDQIFR